MKKFAGVLFAAVISLSLIQCGGGADWIRRKTCPLQLTLIPMACGQRFHKPCPLIRFTLRCFIPERFSS